ncbi:NAD(P)/FAD-dependent oxidoreductase [Mycobacterium sp. 94-17]|uniref:flavin-containing monooxygenase n=1 Tax=Mycobacterium sp. 94-17 TaxID=2986147 RepID=UPI002D1EAADB|nr:NAD(P)/FAD-dependent oxidoreductase [Mycobacterium sp. 94-17]MEB4207737.1 NAD(P)/FAD-dependent oxidoreductase [Mycobacterium sp. 94-17]
MTAQSLDAVIAGAGFSGIAAPIELKKLGYQNFVIVEREDDIGGTWWVNRYPGAAVDIFSTTYQYWFEPNPRWKRLYAEGPELHAYAKQVSDKYDVTRHVRLNSAVESAIWDDDGNVWRVALADGSTLVARMLINATGFLSQRHFPDIEGLETFEGEILHTTWWDPSTDLSGQRVAVIGTGATAVQLLPHVADAARALTVYQRTPIWVLPKYDFAIPERVQNLFASVPLFHRFVSFLTNMLYQFVLMTSVVNHHRFSKLAKFVEWECRALLYLQVRDRKLTKPNVALQTAGIERIEPDGIVARDGTRAQVDTLILATGFNVYDHNFPSFETIGRNGVNLGKWWRENRYASYQALSMPHFPNYIGMTSPFAFTGLSFFDGIRGQVTHINRLLTEVRRKNASTFEVSEAATLVWTEQMRTKMNTSVLFHGDCATANSYYFNDDGDVCWFRPQSTRRATKDQGRFPLSDYQIA